MEAAINEVYLDAVYDTQEDVARGRKHCLNALAECWFDVEHKPILQKYQIALEKCGTERFDPGAEPFQSANDLELLRNALVHFKSEWDGAAGTHLKLEKRLRNRFAESQLRTHFRGKRAWFPHRCLGAGCARWACSSVRVLHEQFCVRVGTESLLG